ncbi:MAG: bifunctional phosphoribosyl-AMP cyclohydrolase/phosphoribosyl-ATP diphosphatase HisIE [Acidimicrobiia bacterium]|nr:bifunctional phosphoribosyl-AMP cyclohydrolase/phosphoribosyl-ATP diphosphatase HisIE [Acidimicrobiia bacterium]
MTDIKYDENGLVVGVVQDAASRRVLMVGYLNEESLRLTRETGRVHFWSRSRGELWEKGATSGNYLNLVEIRQDCDGDALLITARPEGPTCHTGETSCFAEDPDEQGFSRLETLWATMRSRLTDADPESSYTARLASVGPDLTGRKLVEEATETLIAAKNHAAGADRSRVVEESADVIYHLFALLAERNISAAEVIEELGKRAR